MRWVLPNALGNVSACTLHLTSKWIIRMVVTFQNNSLLLVFHKCGNLHMSSGGRRQFLSRLQIELFKCWETDYTMEAVQIGVSPFEVARLLTRDRCENWSKSRTQSLHKMIALSNPSKGWQQLKHNIELSSREWTTWSMLILCLRPWGLMVCSDGAISGVYKNWLLMGVPAESHSMGSNFVNAFCFQ